MVSVEICLNCSATSRVIVVVSVFSTKSIAAILLYSCSSGAKPEGDIAISSPTCRVFVFVIHMGGTQFLPIPIMRFSG